MRDNDPLKEQGGNKISIFFNFSFLTFLFLRIVNFIYEKNIQLNKKEVLVDYFA